MHKILLKTLISILLSTSLGAQQNTVSITAGYKMVGGITKNYEGMICTSGSGPLSFASQKLSSFNAPTISVLYGQALKHNWKFLIGFNHNKKGFGVKYDESVQNDVVLLEEFFFTHNGILMGTEKLFHHKKKVSLSGSFY
jgi:hypothetical protein